MPFDELSCPLPHSQSQITLAHGGGGRLTHRLIHDVFVKAFSNPMLLAMHDSAVAELPAQRLAFTIDSYVVRPLFFPGGDIGKLSITGTVNDLAMSGARPLYVAAAFTIEEGFSIEELKRIADSMQRAAGEAGVQLVTGDTKVVERGKGDGVFITTAGIGAVEHALKIEPASVRPGDVVLLSGDIGRHGIAVMASRENLQFETAIESDCAPLARAVLAMLNAGIRIRCLRDLTRGGLATALNEIAEVAKVTIMVDERTVAVSDGVRGACEILGLDPFYVANEGRFVCFVAPEDERRALAIMREHVVATYAVPIGAVLPATGIAHVVLKTVIGTTRILDMLSGEQLPRIC